MSNRWGNFCTPEQNVLSRKNYSSLHCYTFGEMIGMLLVVISNLVSIVALLYVFAVIVRNVMRERRRRTGRRLISQPMDLFLLSLFVSEFLMSIGGSINIKYMHDGKVQVGTTCNTQAVFSSVGPGTLAMITLVIAIYTFAVVWWRTRKGSVCFAWSLVGAIWSYNIIFITTTTWRYNWEHFFRPTPYWCWIGKYFTVQRLFGDYLWMWSALLLSFLLYIPLFFWSQGYLTPDNQVWWKFHIHSRSLWARIADPEVARRRSMAMIAYPIIFAILVLPQSIVHWLGFVRENTDLDATLMGATFGAQFIYGLSGICNVILLLKTRPNLLLMIPPPEFDDPLSPTLSHRHVEKGHFLPSFSRRLKNEQCFLEVYERTEPTTGTWVDSIDQTTTHPAIDLIPPVPPSMPNKLLINNASSSPPMRSTPANHRDDRLIVPQIALDHAIAHESSIRKALEAACSTTDAAYMIQVGFNENMLQSNQGTLQEIYIFLNFDIQPNNKPQVLDRLSRILSPFPCTVHTPFADLPLPIVGEDGNVLASKERWAVFRSRGIFVPDSNLQADDYSSRTCLKKPLSTRVTKANDKTSSGAGGNFSQTGGVSGSGHTGGASVEPSDGQSPEIPGNDCDSRSGSGVQHPSMEQNLPATLEVPLQTSLEIAWSQEPGTSQKFNTTSRLFVIVQDAATSYSPYDDAQVNSGFGPYPSPTVDARFVHLHVGTTNQPESQERYELHLACVRISATLRSNTLSWSPRTTPGSSNMVRKVEATTRSLGGSCNIAQCPSVSIFHTRGSTSQTERDENLSRIVVESGFTDDTSFVRWTYDINDAKERTSAREFQPPRVKFAFWKPTERPRIGVRLIVTWSLAMPPRKSWSFFLKKKTRPLPVFRTFLQDVSASLQLDGLAEPSRTGDPMLSATSTAPQSPSGPSTAPQQPSTSQSAPENTSTLSSAPQNPSASFAAPNPSSTSRAPPHSSTLLIVPHNLSAPGQRSMDSGMELQAQAIAMRPALNTVGAEVPDVKAVFKSALYGCIRDVKMPCKIPTDSL